MISIPAFTRASRHAQFTVISTGLIASVVLYCWASELGFAGKSCTVFGSYVTSCCSCLAVAIGYLTVNLTIDFIWPPEDVERLRQVRLAARQRARSLGARA